MWVRDVDMVTVVCGGAVSDVGVQRQRTIIMDNTMTMGNRVKSDDDRLERRCGLGGEGEGEVMS
jgi:hypothetical protein